MNRAPFASESLDVVGLSPHAVEKIAGTGLSFTQAAQQHDKTTHFCITGERTFTELVAKFFCSIALMMQSRLVDMDAMLQMIQRLRLR